VQNHGGCIAVPRHGCNDFIALAAQCNGLAGRMGTAAIPGCALRWHANTWVDTKAFGLRALLQVRGRDAWLIINQCHQCSGASTGVLVIELTQDARRLRQPSKHRRCEVRIVSCIR
jgi:hypothetical protein